PLGAQVSHALKARGVDTIFGIPGVHNQEMYRGIEEAGLNHILARHEQGVGFMADGYARATGRPGVCYVITGPGLCNVMTPLGQAYSDSVPVLCISSCLDETAATKGQLHQMKDQRAAAETVCDWSEEARTAEATYQLIDRALIEFETMRPRPKAIHVPIAKLESLAGTAPKAAEEVHRLLDYGAEVDVIEGYLEAAQKPLIIFGGGVESLLAGAVADRFGAATFTTYAARGLIGKDYALNFGSYLARPDSADIIAEADLVVAIGTTLSECDLWRDQLGHKAKMIRVDLDTESLRDGQNADIAVLAPSTPIIEELFGNGRDEPAQTDWDPKTVAATRARWRGQVNSERPGIVPVADALREALPPKTMIYSDMTQFAYAAKEVWDMDSPGHWHHPTGFGTLGYALPAAIGGAVARPGLPTIAIMGDYGFQYTMMELATAVELKLPLPIFIWDNGKLGEIEDSMVRAQIAPKAVVQQNPDFLKLAEAFGAYAAGPPSLAELQKAVKTAFDADRPTIIRVTPEIGL
ncbi:MAG: thiamine pyrophosphate-binding protein, partial [Pseudomonadota bacterium]